MKKSRIIKTSIFVLALYSCTMPSNENVLMTKDTATLTSTDTIAEKQSHAKLELFNEINATRDKLSRVDIGNLGPWRSDEIGGYISITNYFQFGEGDLTNNLAYYLESPSQDHIETLKLVLNINNGDNTSSLQKFSEIIDKTYTALGLKKNDKILKAAKNSIEMVSESETYTEKLKLEKSRIDTWEYLIETK